MHVKGFLHKMLLPVMHKKRLNTLVMLVNTVLISKRLSLTELGRAMSTTIQERSGIRRSDRFLGNTNLYTERLKIIKEVVKRMIGNAKTPDIIVDWSPVPNTKKHILRASLSATGRALTLYEEVHDESKQGNAKVHENFLKALKSLLSEDCKPVILTDGGFHNKWFELVLKQQWDYLGRIRVGSGKKIRLNATSNWLDLTYLSKRSTNIAKFVGQVELCKTNPIISNIYSYKGKKKDRKSLNMFGMKRSCTPEKDYRKAGNEPWLLATSLNGRSNLHAKRVVNKYKKRMQIEEGFRDLKSSRYGFSFENAHSKNEKRIEILLLIAMLASLIAWITGWIGENEKIHYRFQSNSIKKRRVLSLFYLGCQIIKKKIAIPIEKTDMALNYGVAL